MARSRATRQRIHRISSFTQPYRLALAPIQAQFAFAEYSPEIELATAIPIMS